jgi:hypothetical protein
MSFFMSEKLGKKGMEWTPHAGACFGFLYWRARSRGLVFFLEAS